MRDIARSRDRRGLRRRRAWSLAVRSRRATRAPPDAARVIGCPRQGGLSRSACGTDVEGPARQHRAFCLALGARSSRHQEAAQLLAAARWQLARRLADLEADALRVRVNLADLPGVWSVFVSTRRMRSFVARAVSCASAGRCTRGDPRSPDRSGRPPRCPPWKSPGCESLVADPSPWDVAPGTPHTCLGASRAPPRPPGVSSRPIWRSARDAVPLLAISIAQDADGRAWSAIDR
jgi:hypothetical protein